MNNAAIGNAHEFLNPLEVFRNLFRYRGMILTMVWRDFSSRYRGSFGGIFWSIIHPVVMMLVYTIVFSLFLKVKFSTDASPFTFSVYLLCGLLPWSAVSEGLSLSTSVIRGHSNLVKRVVFPLEILPMNLAFTALIQQVIGFFLLVPLAWLVGGRLSWALLLVPLILVLQLLFAIGLNWMIASLAVYLPDLGQMLSLLLMVWMFLTPIFYPEDVMPPNAAILNQINPMAQLVRLYRGAFMTGELPCLGVFLAAMVLCSFLFFFGYYWFMRAKKGFSDVL